MRTPATILATFVVSALALVLLGAEPSCVCEISRPATLKQSGCALCALAEQEPEDAVVFFVKDNSPVKPNRWLALPRMHTEGVHLIGQLPKDVQTTLWREAIAKSKSMWGDSWGAAMNGATRRTQCHVHIHLGKLLPGVEWGDFIEVPDPSEIPDPGRLGLWVHAAADGKMHVHTGETSTENVLLR